MQWSGQLARAIACLSILAIVSGCGTATGAGDPFCAVVGPPPPEMIPAPGDPPGWVDRYLAVFDEIC